MKYLLFRSLGTTGKIAMVTAYATLAIAMMCMIGKKNQENMERQAQIQQQMHEDWEKNRQEFEAQKKRIEEDSAKSRQEYEAARQRIQEAAEQQRALTEYNQMMYEKNRAEYERTRQLIDAQMR